jgi:hypothetical protein
LTVVDKFVSPITIVAYGRSGTSLLSKIFHHHAEVDFIGETAQLVFWNWVGAENSLTVVRKNIGGSGPLPYDEFCGESVRCVLRGLVPSPRKHVVHKPIGIPQAFWFLKSKKIECGDWYWRVLSNSFPSGRFLTILRNPIDVAISGSAYWVTDVGNLFRQLGEMADLITHRDSRIAYAVEYDRLVAEPEAQIRALCDQVSLDFRPSMLRATEIRHVPQKDGTDLRPAIAQMREIVRTEAGQDTLRRVSAMWEKFGSDPSKILSDSRYLGKV